MNAITRRSIWYYYFGSGMDFVRLKLGSLMSMVDTEHMAHGLWFATQGGYVVEVQSVQVQGMFYAMI